MTDFRASGEVVAIESLDQLVETFVTAGKPRSQWRIGVEHEKIAVDPATARAVPFSGPRGIERLLGGLADRFGWERGEEAGRTVSLHRGAVSITLEPGGQVEVAGAPRETLHESRHELETHLREITEIGGDLGMAFLGLGIQPISAVEEIELVPKARYAVMDDYMRRVGSLGLRMMRQTATVQANIDYCDEEDAMRKFRTGMRLAPVMNAMFANSCIVDGDLGRHLSTRGHVWTDTDKTRCGLLAFAWDAGAGFETYARWALDVPAYFLLRDGHYTREVTGIPFRRLLDGTPPLPRPTLDDWNLHLTTLFPEVRLKGFIEFRSADAQGTPTLLGPAALVKGLYYDADCLDAAWDMVKSWRYDECRELEGEATQRALAARMRRHSLRDLAMELGGIAAEGLRRQRRLDDRGRDESIYLEPTLEMVAEGLAPADVTARRWAGEWGRRPERLAEATRLRMEFP